LGNPENMIAVAAGPILPWARAEVMIGTEAERFSANG